MRNTTDVKSSKKSQSPDFETKSRGEGEEKECGQIPYSWEIKTILFLSLLKRRGDIREKEAGNKVITVLSSLSSAYTEPATNQTRELSFK